MNKSRYSTARWQVAIPSEFFLHAASLPPTRWVLFLRESSPDQVPHLAAMEDRLRAAARNLGATIAGVVRAVGSGYARDKLELERAAEMAREHDAGWRYTIEGHLIHEQGPINPDWFVFGGPEHQEALVTKSAEPRMDTDSHGWRIASLR